MSFSHRSHVPQVDSRASPDLPREESIGQPRVIWPGTAVGHPLPEDQVRLSGEDGARHEGEVAGVERPVAVHEAHDLVAGRLEPRVAGGAEAADRLPNHPRAKLLCDPGRSVGGAVVHHDRPVPLQHPPQHPGERSGLVQHRKHHVRHGCAT